MRYAAYAGILALLLFLLFLTQDVSYAFILYYVAITVVFWGFKVLGDKTKNKPLKITAYALIANNILYILVLIVLSNINSLMTIPNIGKTTLYLIVLSYSGIGITYSILLMTLGITLLKTKNPSNIAKVTAATTILSGIIYLIGHIASILLTIKYLTLTLDIMFLMSTILEGLIILSGIAWIMLLYKEA